MSTLSENIKLYRKQNKLTQKGLAERLNISATSVSAWELGRNKPLMDNIEQMAMIFNIKKSDLLGDTFEELNQSPTLRAINETAEQLHEKRQVVVLATAKEQLNEQRAEKQAQEQAQPVRLADYTRDTENRLRGSAIATQSHIDEKVANFDAYRKRVTATVDFAASAGTGAWQEENLGIEVSFHEDEMAEDYDSIGIVVGNSMEPVLKNGDYLFVKVTTDIPNGALSIWQVNGENFVKKFRNNGSPYLESLNPDYDDIDLTPDDDIRPLAVVVDVYREG